MVVLSRSWSKAAEIPKGNPQRKRKAYEEAVTVKLDENKSITHDISRKLWGGGKLLR